MKMYLSKGLSRFKLFGNRPIIGHSPSPESVNKTSIKMSCARNMTTFTEKVKDTVVNKWGRYWQDLIKDYLDALKESYEHGKEYPKKTAIIFSLLGFSLYCFQTNPDELDYRENIINYSNDVLLVAKSVRSPKADQFLTSIEVCYNLGVLKRLNFGFCSLIWVNNYNNDLGLYQSSCSYLKPRYLTFSSRVVDVGFLGKWWRLNSIMQDYDINPEQWKDEETTKSSEN